MVLLDVVVVVIVAAIVLCCTGAGAGMTRLIGRLAWTWQDVKGADDAVELSCALQGNN